MIDSVLTFTLHALSERGAGKIDVYQTVFVPGRTATATIALSAFTNGEENGRTGSPPRSSPKRESSPGRGAPTRSHLTRSTSTATRSASPTVHSLPSVWAWRWPRRSLWPSPACSTRPSTQFVGTCRPEEVHEGLNLRFTAPGPEPERPSKRNEFTFALNAR